MQAEIGLAADLEREQRSFGYGQIRADGLIVGVPGGIDGNDEVVGVVTTEEKDADEGFVVCGALGHGAYQAELTEAADDGSRGGGTAR